MKPPGLESAPTLSGMSVEIVAKFFLTNVRIRRYYSRSLRAEILGSKGQMQYLFKEMRR